MAIAPTPKPKPKPKPTTNRTEWVLSAKGDL